jgi:hypothetical protein
MKVVNLDQIKNDHRYTAIGEALDSLKTGVENMGQQLAVNPQGTTNAPAPPNAINVTANSSGIHRISLTDNNPRTRQVNYFVDFDTDPQFGNAQTEHLGVQRQRSIPQSMGKTPVFYRGYCSYPSGGRSPFIYFGTSSKPTPVVDGATVVGPDFHPTTGSGTSSTGGYGFGQEQFVSSPNQPGKPPSIY